MAISVRSQISGKRNSDQNIYIHKPDIDEHESFSLNNLEYSKPRDYFKSGLKICLQEGLVFSTGIDCKIKSDIPIKAGISSSSAIMVSWIHFLSKIADNPQNWTQQKIGELAYKAEVLEFDEPGGMMDQYSTAVGGLVFLKSHPKITIEKLNSNLGTFVIGDSQQPKNTMGILKRCKETRLSILEKINKKSPNLDFSNIDFNVINKFNLEKDEINLLYGTIKNRNFLNLAKHEISKDKLNKQYIGKLFNEHHKVLRDVLKISTPKIEKLIKVSLNAGAFGAKINGSGGGGCMIAYAPKNPQKILETIENNGGKGFIVKTDLGTIEI